MASGPWGRKGAALLMGSAMYPTVAAAPPPVGGRPTVAGLPPAFCVHGEIRVPTGAGRDTL